MLNHFASDDDVIAAAATSGRLDADAVYEFCRALGVSFRDYSNELSLKVADRFDRSLISFDDADGVMNAIWGLMLDYVTRIEPNATIWEPTYSIFCAFDDGEYDHGDGGDPVEQFTKSAIKRILKERAVS